MSFGNDMPRPEVVVSDGINMNFVVRLAKPNGLPAASLGIKPEQLY